MFSLKVVVVERSASLPGRDLLRVGFSGSGPEEKVLGMLNFR